MNCKNFHFYCVHSIYHLSGDLQSFYHGFVGSLAECRRELNAHDYGFEYCVYRVDVVDGCVLSITDMTFPRRSL